MEKSNENHVACGVPWCVAMAELPAQFCIIHERHPEHRTTEPPPVKRELQKRYNEETAAFLNTRTFDFEENL